jgi:hypothetical protein
MMERSEAPAIAGARGMAGPQRVARVLGRVQARPLGQFLHNAGDIDRRESAHLYPPMPGEERNTGPAAIAAASTHVCNVRTGQVSGLKP